MVWYRASSALVLLVFALAPTLASGQKSERRHGATPKMGRLEANQPNPFPSETSIPFRIGEDSCETGTGRHVVTLRIYNILSQLVAVPVLVDLDARSDSLAPDDSTSTPPRPITDLSLSCGTYAARWDGKHGRTGRLAPPGVYMYQLIVDGRPSGMRKMVVARP